MPERPYKIGQGKDKYQNMLLIAGIQVFKLIQVVVISGVKFLFAPFISIGYGFNYFQTVLFTTVGGILGMLFLVEASISWLHSIAEP